MNYSVAAIVPCAGSGKRLASATPKQYLSVGGKSILSYSLSVFDQMEEVRCVIIPIANQWKETAAEIAAATLPNTPFYFVEGGTERQFSIANALQHEAARRCDIVLVHDAARPFISANFVRELLPRDGEAWERYAVIPALPPKETVKRVAAGDTVAQTLPRQELRLVQTPQVFSRPLLEEAYQYALRESFLGTDDASLAELAGFSVQCRPGSPHNIKITTPEDLMWADFLLKHIAGEEKI